MSLSLNLLTTSELSTLIKRAPETLIRWRRLRIGPPYLLVEGRVLYDEGEVRRWLDARRTPMTVPRPDKSSGRGSGTAIPVAGNAPDASKTPPSRVPAPPLEFAFDPSQTWEVFDA